MVEVVQRRRLTSRIRELKRLLSEKGKVTVGEMAVQWVLSPHYVRMIFKLAASLDQSLRFDPDEDALILEGQSVGEEQ
jgi:hypothetical protein